MKNAIAGTSFRTTADHRAEAADVPAGDGGLAVLRHSSVDGDVYGWLAENLKRIDDLVTICGGVVLQGTGFIAESEFYRAMRVLSSDRLDQVHVSTRRHRLSALLWSVEEPPADSGVPPHNMNASAAEWPERVYLYCLVPGDRGGETLVADARAVHRRLDPLVRRGFERDGLTYVRRFTEHAGQEWQRVFGTDDPAKVERYCETHGADFEWGVGRTGLTTRRRGPATTRHPVTGEALWFNHAHLFSEHSRPSIEVRYGNGRPLERDVLAHLRHVYELETSTMSLLRGDIVVLDNHLLALGRAPFTGHRMFVTATV